MTAPVRVIRSRVKGSRLTSPNGLPVVCVTRGTKWGNPYTADNFGPSADIATKKRLAVAAFRNDLKRGALAFSVDDMRRELRGKNLACWCKESPCHADILLEVANS